MRPLFSGLVLILLLGPALGADENPFVKHGRLRVSQSGTHLEHADGKPFFFLADTCWTGPALSDEAGWQKYLTDRKKKGFTAVQFNIVSPWRTARTDAEGRQAYTLSDGRFAVNEEFYKRVDARLKAINDAGMLAVPVLCWALKKGDAGVDLSEENIITLIKFEIARYQDANVLWILAGDNRYSPEEAAKWKRVGRAVFGENSKALVTTHPTGMNFPWKTWENESWLNVLGYQSGHGDDANTLKWIHSGPAAEYGKSMKPKRPLINLEPPYEAHNGYLSRKPHSDFSVRRAVYWSLLAHATAGVTYGGHGVWSWHTKPGQGPTDHESTGVAKLWSEALDLPGATQMGYARTLFESLPWTKLSPHPELLQEQPGSKDPHRFITISATPDLQTIVAYTPIGGQVPIKPLQNKREPLIEWYNPRTGKKTMGDDKFQTPDEQDWVLVIRR